MLSPGVSYSEEVNILLPQAEIESKFEEQDFVGPLFTETDTRIKVTEKGINALGPFSTMSVQKSISLMPSVNQGSVDPTGLADISNYHESFRFRGVEPTGGGNPSTPVNVESVPVTGRPGGGVAIYDMENFQSISIFKGGVPADQAFGLTNIGGKIDMEVKRPGEEFSFNMKQSMGSDAFQRSFLRLDTGLLPWETAGFLSCSKTDLDKWKGAGKSTRDNAMVGLSQQMGGLNVGLFSIYNNSKVNTYRALNYEKASALDKNYKFDYSRDKTDYFYYDYNKSNFEDYNMFADIEYEFNEHSKLAIKPFYWNDDGYYLETITMKNGKNRIRRWDIDHDIKGILTQYSLKMKAVDLNLGFFSLEQERPGPPTSWKLYQVSPDGLVFDKWQILSNPSKHRQNTPFVSGKYTHGYFSIEGGIKYLNYTMPAITTYNTTGIPDVSYEKALDLATSVEADASAEKKAFNKLLPHLGLNYMINEYMSCYFSYGRNHGLSVSLYPYFISQKKAFYDKGITLQDLWDGQELEMVDNYDLGLRYISDTLYVVPTLYYARHRNKTATYYDTSLGASFPATSADADAYGFELEAGAMPFERFSLYASFSYNRFFFSQDIFNQDGSVNSIKDNQVPDAPEFLFKGIASYEIGNFILSPIVRYASKRYGDILHREEINGEMLFDFDVTYRRAFPKMKIRKMDFSLSINNVFDKKYVSIINTSDYKTLGPSYQTGAPFTVYASASVHF